MAAVVVVAVVVVVVAVAVFTTIVFLLIYVFKFSSFHNEYLPPFSITLGAEIDDIFVVKMFFNMNSPVSST